MNTNKDKITKKGLTWIEFEEKLDKIFESIQKLIQNTNGTQNDR